MAKRKINWQLQLNQTGLTICVRVFDWSTTVRKVVAKTQCQNQKQCSKWPPPALTHPERRRRHWCTEAAMTAWSSLSHSVLMQCLNLVEISHACFGHLFLQYFPHTFGQLHGCKSGEFGGHMRGKMNSSVSLLARTAFWNDVTMTSSLRSVVQALIGHFTIFSHTDCQDDSCQKLYKVV